jgi:nitroreductase
MNEAIILKQIIERRRSIVPKEYSGAAIPTHILDAILNAASFAPNHKRTRPWRFKTFSGIDKNNLGEVLAAVYKNITPPQLFLEKKYVDITDKITKSDVVLAVVINFSGLVPQWEEVAATAMAIQNMYLTCTAYNVGCYWSTPDLKDHINEFLALEENQQCYGFFYLGMME